MKFKNYRVSELVKEYNENCKAINEGPEKEELKRLVSRNQFLKKEKKRLETEHNKLFNTPEVHNILRKYYEFNFGIIDIKEVIKRSCYLWNFFPVSEMRENQWKLLDIAMDLFPSEDITYFREINYGKTRQDIFITFLRSDNSIFEVEYNTFLECYKKSMN